MATFIPVDPANPSRPIRPKETGERWYVKLPYETELRYVRILYLSEKVVTISEKKTNTVLNFLIDDVVFVEYVLLELPDMQ